MVLTIRIAENLSLSFPILKTLGKDQNAFLLSIDPNSASLVKPGLQCSLITKTNGGKGFNGTQIQSIQQNKEGFVVTV